MPAELRVCYDNAERFRTDLEKNLSMGGTFIPTTCRYEFRDVVNVVLELAFNGSEIELPAEVVSVVPEEMAGAGGRPGVAVHFTQPATEVRRKLADLLGSAAPKEHRIAPRRIARISAIVSWAGEEVTGRSLNLSHTGVLLSLEGPPIAVGESVRVSLRHPTLDESLEVAGQVARHVNIDGSVTSVAIHFEPRPDEKRELVEFIDDIQASEHARRLRGISGAIGEVGLVNLVQVFGSCSRSGTLTVTRAEEEGLIAFADGMLRDARLGAVSGMKAFTRMLGWREGAFEFHARVSHDPEEAPRPLDGAVLEAVRQVDELARLDLAAFPMSARLEVSAERLESERSSLSKLEDSVVDLAGAGLSLRAVLDVIPEPDSEICAAVVALADRGLIAPRL